MGEKPGAGAPPSRSADVAVQGEQAPTLPATRAPESTDDGVIDACTKVLERYSATPECTLVFAGYLDLFGNVWACLVFGSGWAELSVVRAGENGVAETSQARIDSPLLQDSGGEVL